MSFVGEQDFCEECDEPVIIEFTHQTPWRGLMQLHFSCGHVFRLEHDH